MTNSKNKKLLARVTMLIAVLAIFASTNRILAQTLTEDGLVSTGNGCGNQRCCLGFTFTAGAATDKLVIALQPKAGTTPGDCWQWGCFNGEIVAPIPQALGAGMTITTPVSTPTPTPAGEADITFSPALAAGDIVKFILCPRSTDPDCVDKWTTYNWTSSNGGITNGSGTGINLDSCVTNDGIYSCSDCDSVQVTDNGSCSITICFYIGGGNQTKNVDFVFSHPLTSDNINGRHSGPNNPNDPCNGTNLVLPSGWSISAGGTVGSSHITLHCGTALTPCHWLCFNLPKDHNHTLGNVTVQGLDYVASPCGAASANFKKSEGGIVNMQGNNSQNYPNPVSKYGNFKTVIPFMTANGGEAILRVYNSAGKIAFSETSEFDGGGTHFFYLTAKDLPSGSYYYTIESPKGAVIVRHQLIVVK